MLNDKMITLSNGYEGPALKIFSSAKHKWAIMDAEHNIIQTFFNEEAAKFMLQTFNNPTYYIDEVWL
jgi:hypothetical protein